MSVYYLAHFHFLGNLFSLFALLPSSSSFPWPLIFTCTAKMDQIPPGITVYNLPTSPPVWDKLGIFYITWAAAWTTLVFSGMVFCWINRKSPILKIRGLPLSFGAIILLHSYWILAQITYPIAHTMPLVLAYDIQFFFMGIYFPLGVALFHASNLRFLHIAKLQKQFTHPALRLKSQGCNGASTSWLCRFRNIGYTKRIMSFIGLGMVIQVLACHTTLQLYPANTIFIGSPYCRLLVCRQEIPPYLRPPGYRDEKYNIA